MMAKQYLTEGKRFGKLTLIKEIGKGPNRNFVWLCKCDCGKECEVYNYNLLRGNTKSCGCLMERLITFNGKTQNMSEWAREIRVPYTTLAKRFSRGWSVEKALTQPLGRYKQGE